MESDAIIDTARIEEVLARARAAAASRIREILAKASELKGLSSEEVADLASVKDPELVHALYETAKKAKLTIYGTRLVLFAPLYVSNLCANECSYCAFRCSNRTLKRRALTQEEIAHEVEILVDQGHKRVLLVSGEAYPREGFDYILKAIGTVYGVKKGKGAIRRVNVNVAPLEVAQFKALKAAGIGTYQLFQETYHRPTYAAHHLAGKKKDFDWRVSVLDRAMEGGIDDVGVGVLFGLHDWRYEILALMEHARHLESRFGVGPHTISVPRIEPAHGSDIANSPPHAVGDEDFFKIIAILRLAVPYTGIILSTRESAETRRRALELGISQISAGSRTNPGGYAEDEALDAEQFQLGDHRTLDEVVRDVVQLGYIPSFCTACYRMGRTGKDFMDLAKPGQIRTHCDPNGLSTFLEYLLDYASPETAKEGTALVEATLGRMTGPQKTIAQKLVDKVRAGKRDALV